MQKSKSSSNVGQFVSKKIWRSRSRSQTRTASPIKSEWTPQGNCVWTTPAGKRVVLSDVRLQDLTEIERKILHRVAVEKINQLNIGINVTAPNEVSNSNTETTQKKRRPLLIKRKALTTSFFDTGKKTEDKGGGSGLVFGVSLEKCVNNDSRAQNVKSTSSTTGLDRGSRNSIASLLDSSSKGGENIGSCESLPSHSSATAGPHSASRRISDDINTFGYQSGISDQMSRSQIDFHRLSQDEDELLASAPPMVGSTRNNGQQVPALVTACINHLEDHGMHTVGIFRVSTSKKRVRQLREDFDKGEISTLDPDICPHDVATILKEYLRDLPEPLLCKNLYKAFVKTQKIRNRRLQLEALSHLIQLLPVAHRDTLYVLLRFLAKIVRSSDDITSRDGTVLSVGNKMDSNNLATVFAPNILRYSSPGRNTAEQEIDEQIDVINVIRTMIDHYEELFRVPAELVDEIYTNMMDSHPQQLNYLCEKRDLLEKYDANNTTSGSSTTGSISLVASSPSISSPISDQSSTRRVYSREDFLHENAAKCETNGNISKRRERSSKTKHQETEEIAGRRHRRDRYISDGTTSGGKHQYPMRTNEGVIRNSSGDSVNQINLQQQKQLQEQQDSSFKSMSRRLSSPHVLQNTNIVTASLMIPVQVQSNNNIDQKQQQQQINPHLNHNYTGQLDLQDIPFIEDEGALSSSYVYNEPVKGSISLRGKSDIRKDHQSAEVTQTQKSSYSSSVFNRGKGDGVAQLTTQNKQSQSHSSEPKISTSIMNIGGAVLRSKTADFERISNQQTKKSQQPTNMESVTSSSSGQIITGSSSAAPPSSASSSSLNENVKTRRSSQGPVYKRQELISSAKSK